MADKKDYGSTDKKEDEPLVDRTQKARPMMSASRLPLVIGLDNADFRHAVFGILLIPWLVPSFIVEAIKLSDGGCQDPQFCDTWIASYVIIFVAMGFYKWMFMYIWYKDFSEEAISNKCITLLKYSSGGCLFVGAIILTVAVGKGLDDLCISRNAYCRAGTFGIYLFPILIIFALAADILFYRYDIGSFIRMRCGIYSGIIFICSLLITSDLFGSETSFNSSTMGVYQCGWLITLIISFIIYIYIAFGFYKNLKLNHIKAFYAFSYFCLALPIGPSMTLISDQGYMTVSRMTFPVLGLCAILNIELFLL